MGRASPPRVAWPHGLLPFWGVVAGVAAAVAVTALQDPTYRADASIVLVRQGQPPGSDPELAAAAAAAAELFESRAVAASAISNLGLEEPPERLVERLDARVEAESSLVRLRVDAPDETEARRTAQEVAEVSTVLFNDRFGPQTAASVWEPASTDPERVSPKPARNVALGALAGALAGWALLLLASRRPLRAPRPAAPPEPAAAAPPPPAAEPTRAAARELAPPPSEPATGPFVLPAFGRWTIGDVERLVADQGSAFPDKREEIELYVETLRTVAAPDGHLPGDVELVVEDVFGDLIARSNSPRSR